jgi:hypothetical protein
MRKVLVVAFVAIACAAAHPSAQFGQSGPPPKPTGPAPRAADGHPDLSGVWWPGQDVPVQTLRVGSARAAASTPRPGSLQSLYKPDALERWKSLSDKDDPALRCIPVAFGTLNVSLFGLGFIGQIIQTPKFVTMLTETYHSFKIIPVDGRPHRDDVAPSFRGDSVGRWDGDTLVVDTTNYLPNATRVGASDKLHTIEKFRRVAQDTLEYYVTFDDASVWSRPWTLMIPLKMTGERMFEFACHEGNYGLPAILRGARELEKNSP